MFYMMNWYVYILECADSSLYTDITTDLERRLAEHNKNDSKAARYTRARRPVSLVYAERVENRSYASKREYSIRKLTRASKIALIDALQSQTAELLIP